MKIECQRNGCKYTIYGPAIDIIVEEWDKEGEFVEMPFLICPKCFNRMKIVRER